MITWLASYPKSGNTWIRLLLSAYFTGKADINSINFCLGDNDRYFHQSLSPKPELSQADITLLRPAALLHMTSAVATRPLVVKSHHANCDVDGIPMFPPSLTSCAVYLIRDPRDVAISNARHFGISIDDSIDCLNDRTRAIGEDNYLHYMGSWSQHVESWTCGAPFKVHGVKFEALKENPTEKLTSILERIGVDVDESKVLDAVRLTDFGSLSKQEDIHGFKERPKKMGKFFHSGESTWLNTLSESQINRIESEHHETMIKHGYTPVTL